jgi:hypothetical protein
MQRACHLFIEMWKSFVINGLRIGSGKLVAYRLGAGRGHFGVGAHSLSKCGNIGTFLNRPGELHGKDFSLKMVL